MSSKKALRPGQKIKIPWGLDRVNAVVRDIIIRDNRRYVLLLIELRGDPGIPDEIIEWQFPEESLLAAMGD